MKKLFIIQVISKIFLLLKRKVVSFTIQFMILDNKKKYEFIYKTKYWKNNSIVDSSLSGAGSSLSSTINIRNELTNFITKNKIKTITDIPCGDFYWLKEISFIFEKYFGGDIVDQIIKDNKKKFINRNLFSFKIDILKDNIPESDMFFCRDLIVHLNFDETNLLISKLKRLNFKYIALTHFDDINSNQISIHSDNWKKINLMYHPFNISKPDFILDDTDKLHHGRKIAIWKKKNFR